MKAVRSLLLVLSTSLVAHACASTSTAPATAPGGAGAEAPVDDVAAIVAADMEDQIAYMTRFGDEACACTDRACAEDVDARLTPVLIAENKEDLYSKADADRYQPAFSDRLAEAYVRYIRCLGTHQVVTYSIGAGLIGQFEALAEDGCACTDAACARDIERAAVRWAQGIKKWPVHERELPRVTAAADQLWGCVDPIYEAAGIERGQDALIAAKDLRARACACADDDCYTEVGAAFDQWKIDHGEASMTPRVGRELQETLTEFFACSPTYIPAEAQRALDELAALRDRGCACRDEACAQHVYDGFVDLAARHKDTKGSDASIEEFRLVYGELATCLAEHGWELGEI